MKSYEIIVKHGNTGNEYSAKYATADAAIIAFGAIRDCMIWHSDEYHDLLLYSCNDGERVELLIKDFC